MRRSPWRLRRALIATTSVVGPQDLPFLVVLRDVDCGRPPLDRALQAVGEIDPRARSFVREVCDRVANGDCVRSALLPAVALELHEMASDPNVHLKRVAERAVTDPSIAARVIALGSSPLYSPHPPRTVKDALARIGLDGVRHVVFDAAFQSRLLRRGPLLPLVERTIRHARTMSVIARHLAIDVGVHPGTAGLAGLLHALGAIVLFDEFSAKRGAALPRSVAILTARVLHSWVAARVAKNHAIEPEVVQALRDHHDHSEPTLPRLLWLCDRLSPAEPGQRAAPLEECIARSGLPLRVEAVTDRLRPLLVTVEELVRDRIAS